MTKHKKWIWAFFGSGSPVKFLCIKVAKQNFGKRQFESVYRLFIKIAASFLPLGT